MADQEKNDTQRRLDEIARDLNKTLARLADQVHQQNVTLTEYTTVLRRHLVTQEQINERVAQGLSGHDARLRELENYKARLEATLPTRWLDTETVEADIHNVKAEVATIRTTIAKWGGVVSAVIVVAQIVVPPIFRWLFGGGM